MSPFSPELVNYIANKHCPISFRTLDPVDDKKTLLMFYEQNNHSEYISRCLWNNSNVPSANRFEYVQV